MHCLVLGLRFPVVGGAMTSATEPEQPISRVCDIVHYIILFAALAYQPISNCGIGLAFGGIYGIREGYTRPLSVSSSRLRVNSILNSVTRRGSYFANSAGVIGEQDHLNILFRSLMDDIVSVDLQYIELEYRRVAG
jgi:hypothetical protein